MARTKERLLFDRREIIKTTPLCERLREAGAEFARWKYISKREGGLVTPSQAATVLGVSRQRMSALQEAKKLTRYSFFERSFLSVREVEGRLQERIEALAIEEGVSGEDAAAAYEEAVKEAASEWKNLG